MVNFKSNFHLIVGLGNPGPEYARTRHNVGFMAIDCLAGLHNLSFLKEKNPVLLAQRNISGKEVVLVKPLTNVNNSGEIVRALVDIYKLPPENIWVIHDDVNLDIGKIRIRIGGGSGGHKGIESLIKYLNNKMFVHFKIGIGRPDQISVFDYVLLEFSETELEIILKAIKEVAQAIEFSLTQGLVRAQNKYNAT